MRFRLLSPFTLPRPSLDSPTTPVTHRVRSIQPRAAGMLVVPVFPLPLSGDSLRPCPTCGVIHRVKSVHLWLDSSSSALVSTGVLEHLQLAGAFPPNPDAVLTLDSSLTPQSRLLDHGRPPGITIASRNAPSRPRPLQDREAARQTIWTGTEVVTVDRREARRGVGEEARRRRREG